MLFFCLHYFRHFIANFICIRILHTTFNLRQIKVRDVLQCKHVIEYFAETERICELLLQKWGVVEELRKILHVPYLTTVVLQNNDFTLSDFYGCLQIIDLKLNQIVESPGRKFTALARKLQQCVNERKVKLIDNPLMITALFLDPRYKFAIDSDPEKVRLAKMHIGILWERIQLVKNGTLGEREPETSEMNVTPENMSAFFAELDVHLTQSTGLHASATERCDKSVIVDSIDKYESSVIGFRMSSSESIHQYWENKKDAFGSELYEIASVVFAVPPTQASVERDFSALKFIFTDYRYNLKQDLLEFLLLIHLNKDFFNLVKADDIECVSKSA